MLKKTVKISGILCLIAFLTALLLGLTNEFTKDTIAQRQQESITAAMTEVVPAENYNLIENVADDYTIYAASNNDTLVGYTVSLAESGYGGKINMMIGINKELEISGISITDMSETPGLGDNAKNPEFTGQFKNISKNDIALTKDGGKINALSGATVTSKAVMRGVLRAIELVSSHVNGGAEIE